MIDVQSVMIQLVGVVSLIVNAVLIIGGLIAAVRYYCQKMTHRLTDKHRFDQHWADEAYRKPQAVVDNVDDAVGFIADNIADILSRVDKPSLVRSGFADPERWERMDEQWRSSLERGEPAGSVVPAGTGWSAHVHAFPEQRRAPDAR